MEILLVWLVPILIGSGMWWMSNKVRGRNAQKSLRYAALGFWFLLLIQINPFLFPLSMVWTILKFVPSVLSFLAAGNSMLKEMRAQQRGEYTERAL